MKHKRQCRFCPRWFTTCRNKKQWVCSRKRCQKKREQREWRRWARKNKKQKRFKLIVWAKAYPNYWRHYRATRDKYRRKDNRRRVKTRRRARSVRKAKADISS